MLKLFVFAQSQLVERLRREEGQTLAEYAVVLSVITVAALAALLFLGGRIAPVINRVGSAIS